MSISKYKYVASVDVGTTYIRCHIYNKKGEIISHAKENIKIYNPQPGRFEINPHILYNDFINVLKAAVGSK